MDFKSLHNQEKPFILCNVWDVNSSKVAEKLGFKAIGTSSAAISSMLGYKDGEEIAFSELEYFIKRILANTSIPLSVDIESGYSRNTKIIIENVIKLSDLGVAGFNIEDSVVEANRKLLDSEEFGKTIYEIKNELLKKKINIFMNVRTDTFIVTNSNTLKETQQRIKIYELAGADGIFIPCVVEENDIKEIVNCTKLPINVMCMPKLPGFITLQSLGVKRISMGNFLFDYMYKKFEESLASVLNNQSFKNFF